ncbi:MAG: biotin--[acetyl-CoA-carboxylase] ligase [Flavobacteriaceae bacterium]|nr:biotin--[acetyl-CoA-carboxylase] ligase [Flavobacteriaceae bacterium]
MKIIKLDAINSTNSFLKELSQNTSINTFTVVQANYQTSGRGQMGSQWVSEPNKNLLCSVFVRFNGLPVSHQVLINYAVSLAIFTTLQRYKLPEVAIKWPNDILSSHKKVCGILVENVIHKDKISSSIIGIGLNVNQLLFPKGLNAVTSMQKVLGKEINIDVLLQDLLSDLKKTIAYITDASTNVLKKNYLQYLYKKNIPTMFKNSSDVLFMGKIVGVSTQGKLQIALEDDTINEFAIKEVSFA